MRTGGDRYRSAPSVSVVPADRPFEGRVALEFDRHEVGSAGDLELFNRRDAEAPALETAGFARGHACQVDGCAARLGCNRQQVRDNRHQAREDWLGGQVAPSRDGQIVREGEVTSLDEGFDARNLRPRPRDL